jgi:hypothetical protein
MKRLPMTIGMIAAGLLVGVLPPAVANATSAADPGNRAHSTTLAQRDPHGIAVASATPATNPDGKSIPTTLPVDPPNRIECVADPSAPLGERCGTSSTEPIGPMHDMEHKMAQFAKESAQSTAVITGGQTSVSQMAKNAKQ